MILKSIEGIMFLSYLTKYNIAEIYRALEYYTFDDYYNSDLLIKGKTVRATYSDSEIRNSIKEADLTIDKDRYYKIFHVSYFSEKYPKSLLKIATPPPILYIKGKMPEKKLLAVVGTREPSIHAAGNIETVVKDAIELGYGITSGLAVGIDTLAHISSVLNNGYTVAVMPNSLDTIYPKENYKNATLILDANGALVTELPIGINRGRQSFIERNRIQTALSDFVLPVEMSVKSGTMHTVRFCKSQKKKLVLIKPSDECKELREYEGINYLIEQEINKISDDVLILNTYSELKDYLIKRNNETLQLGLGF